MTMRRGHHTSSVLKAMGAKTQDHADADTEPAEIANERAVVEPE
jgi:hypothetical protein